MILLSLILLFFGKQGVGATYEDCQGLQSMNVGWFYNWSRNPPLCEGVEAVPMIWCDNLGTLGGNSPWLLGPNEPDVHTQCNKTPQAMAVVWREIEEAYPDKLLVSPAVMWIPWLRSWMNAYADLYGTPPRVDAVAVHCYVWTDNVFHAVDYCKQQVDAAYSLGFGKVWVTEFAWLGDVNVSYMLLMRSWLERDPRVARYAWFELSYSGKEEWAFYNNTSLIDFYTHELTEYGQAYKGFNQIFLPVIR